MDITVDIDTLIDAISGKSRYHHGCCSRFDGDAAM
jgi:hypothetical protein